MYMFRELMNYCVNKITSTGSYSLSLQHSATMSFVILSFWSGNVFHRVCLGSSPRGMLLPRRILNLLASFLSLFETPPSCIALIGVDEKLVDCFQNSLPGTKKPFSVKTYEPVEFESSLALPTAQIIERHDFRSILDFLLMKMRTALDGTGYRTCQLCIRYSIPSIQPDPILFFLIFHKISSF